MRVSVRERVLVLCTALAIVALPARAWAGGAPDSAERKQAADLKRQGDALFDQGKYSEAYVFYVRAFEVARDPALLYNQGRTLEAMGDYPEAIEKLEGFAATATPQMRARVPELNELIAGIRARVSTLIVTSNVAGARVLLRERLIGTVDGSLRRSVRAGAASIDVTAEGYDPFRKEIDLPASGELKLEITLLERKNAAHLSVRTEPSASLVTIGGTPYGPSPIEAKLAPGTYVLLVERSGYDKESTPVTLAGGEKRDVLLTLHKTPPITAKWWFWGGLGAAVLGGAALTVALISEGPAGSGSFSPGQVRGP